MMSHVIIRILLTLLTIIHGLMTSLDPLYHRRGADKATNGLTSKRGHSDETGLNNEAELQNVNNQIGNNRTKINLNIFEKNPRKKMDELIIEVSNGKKTLHSKSS